MYKKFILSYLICLLAILSLCPNVQGIEIKYLSLAPAAEPVPASSYRLLPSFPEQINGNAALFYYSATGFYPDGDTEDITEKIRQWLELPVEQLDRKEVEMVLSTFSNCFHQIELASQRNNCQWEMPLEEGFSMLIPSLSSYRNIARAMVLQIRLYIADGEINKAMKMLQDGLYMGTNIAEGHTIVQGLVGIAIDALMLKEVENLIQIPDSANLYWALTSLPDPPIDIRSSMQYEREALFFEFSELRNIENRVLTPEHASLTTSNILNKIQTFGGGSTNGIPFNKLIPAGWVMMHYSDAKKHLADKGFSQEQIASFPAAQAVLIYQKQQYMEIADNMYKWFEIPYSQAQSYLKKSDDQLEIFSNQGIKSNLFSILLPALSRVAFLQARLDRDIAMLRTIEAIRMFAADNTNQLPETLAEITKVPIPLDPVTGEDFIYRRLNNTTARLEATVSPEESENRPVYELNIKP